MRRGIEGLVVMVVTWCVVMASSNDECGEASLQFITLGIAPHEYAESSSVNGE